MVESIKLRINTKKISNIEKNVSSDELSELCICIDTTYYLCLFGDEKLILYTYSSIKITRISINKRKLSS